jgi:hypothetical protein
VVAILPQAGERKSASLDEVEVGKLPHDYLPGGSSLRVSEFDVVPAAALGRDQVTTPRTAVASWDHSGVRAPQKASQRGAKEQDRQVRAEGEAGGVAPTWSTYRASSLRASSAALAHDSSSTGHSIGEPPNGRASAWPGQWSVRSR